MKKTKLRFLTIGLAMVFLAGMLGGCGNRRSGQQETDTGEVIVQTVRVGSLKGPTSMGLLFLMEKAGQGEALNSYEFQMTVGADELLALMVKGELDIALIPANVASVLYNKTEGGIRAIDINTLGVLYMVSGDTEAFGEAGTEGLAQLKGRTVYLTGKGTTPDYVLQYLLQENGVQPDECRLEYKSEAAEVAAVLAENPNAVGLLPQPFVTAACTQNDALSVIFDMNEEWERVQNGQTGTGSRLVTGVTVVRSAFLEENPQEVANFLQEHEESADSIKQEVQKGAALAVEAGIVAKEAIAKKAIPECNITYIEGEEMKQALSGYLGVLWKQSPESVGGSLPEDDFYYMR